MPCRAKYNHTKPHNNIPHHTIHKHTNLDQQNRRALHKYSATKRQADIGKRYNQTKAMQGNDGKVKPAAPIITQSTKSSPLTHCTAAK